MSRLLQILLLFVSLPVLSQEIVLDKKVDDQYKEKFGPNLRFYSQPYIGLGFISSYNDKPGAEIAFGRSVDFITGSRYKLKLLSFYAVGIDVSYRYMRYAITGPEHEMDNPFFRASVSDKFALGVSSMGLEAYNRFNIGKRGNILGKYIDIGFRFQWNYATREKMKDREDDGEKVKIVRRRKNYIEKETQTVTGRIGYNKFVLFGDYNLSGLFKSELEYPSLPPLSIGIQLAL